MLPRLFWIKDETGSTANLLDGVERKEDLIVARNQILALVTWAMLALSGTTANAEDVGDIRLGRSIASKDCAQCHAMGGKKSPTGTEAPSFDAIANMASASVLSIRVFLRTSHRNKTMPNIMLTEEEVDAVATYILSLRTK